MNRTLAVRLAVMGLIFSAVETALSAIEASTGPTQLELVLSGGDFGKRGPIVQSCYVRLQTSPRRTPVYMNLTIIKTAGSDHVDAIVSESIDGTRRSRMALVEPEFSTIRPGLGADFDTDDATLNGGERMILHAMLVSELTELNEKDGAKSGIEFSTGIDLSLVRATKIFYVDRRPGDIGSAAVVEALDANGKWLGTFLGGFLVQQCR